MAPPIRTLIVDDEPLARRGLRLRLAGQPDIEVVGECSHGAEVLRCLPELKPDLMFLDVQMPGMDGFETLRAVPLELRPVVVFVTAFDHHAVAAFTEHALDYLLKPVDDARLAASLDRVRESLSERAAEAHRDRLMALLARLAPGDPELAGFDPLHAPKSGPLDPARDVLAIKDGQKIVRVPMPSIRWIEAAGDYMCVHTDSETHVLRATLRDLETQLDPKRFQRVHRSSIVNIARVREMRSHMNGEYFLILDSGHELKLSRSYRDKLELLR